MFETVNYAQMLFLGTKSNACNLKVAFELCIGCIVDSQVSTVYYYYFRYITITAERTLSPQI